MKTKYGSPTGKWEDDCELYDNLDPRGLEQEPLSDDELIAHYRSLRSDVIKTAQGLKVNSEAERVHRRTIKRYTELINELEVKVYFDSKFSYLKKGAP